MNVVSISPAQSLFDYSYEDTIHLWRESFKGPEKNHLSPLFSHDFDSTILLCFSLAFLTMLSMLLTASLVYPQSLFCSSSPRSLVVVMF